MLIEDYSLSINRFEGLLQKITANTTSGILFERLPPSEIWERSETDVTSLQNLVQKLNDYMVTLKPERAPTIEKHTQATLQPLNNFREILFRKSGDPEANSKLALDELRRAVMEGSKMLDLAKEIKDDPSESIVTILKLKEVYDAKEYLSAIPVPEATHVRFVRLKRDIDGLKLSIANLERTLEELRRSLNSVVEEISKYKPLPSEKPEENTGPEPTLVSEEKE